MEIEEVPIQQDKKTRKPPPPKITRAADEYLAEKGVGRQQLSSDQFDCVIKYMKYRRSDRLMTYIYIASTIIYGFMFFSLYYIAMKGLNDDGKKLLHVGIFLGCLAFTGGVSLGHVLGRILRNIYERSAGKFFYEKIFDAFLPAIKYQTKAGIESPTEFGR